MPVTVEGRRDLFKHEIPKRCTRLPIRYGLVVAVVRRPRQGSMMKMAVVKAMLTTVIPMSRSSLRRMGSTISAPRKKNDKPYGSRPSRTLTCPILQ